MKMNMFKRLALTALAGLFLHANVVWAVDTKISALPAASALGATDVVPIVQGGATKKATVTQLAVFPTSAPVSFASTLSDLSTSKTAWSGTVTIPDNVSSVTNTTTSTIGPITLNMPANPVDGQFLTITSKGQVSALTHSGNGKTLTVAILGFSAGQSYTYRYSLSDTTWHLIASPFGLLTWGTSYYQLATFGAGSGTPGFRTSWTNISGDLYLTAGKVFAQSTASGLSAAFPSQVVFQTENTLDVTNASASNGSNSISGLWARTYNSTVAYGGGATNDVEISTYLVNTGQKYASGAFWTSSPAGIGSWLVSDKAPIYIGTTQGGEAIRIDQLTSNASFSHGVGDLSKVKVTVGATQTIPNNIRTYIVKGAIAAATITFPAAPFDGQLLTVTFSGVVAALTMDGNGKTLNGGFPAATVAGTSFQFIYDLTDTTWYRVSGLTSWLELPAANDIVYYQRQVA